VGDARNRTRFGRIAVLISRGPEYNKPNEAKSNLCHTVYKHGHGTSNLHEHLRRKHQSKLNADKSKLELEKDLDILLAFR